MTVFHLPSMKHMYVNNSKQLRLCAALIVVSIFVYLPTTLVLGQNKVIHTISINKDSGSANTNIFESSRVEYVSSGWTNFTLTALTATYQIDGGEKDYFDTNYSAVFFNVYSGISNELIYYSFLYNFLFDEHNIPLENESTISLVFFIVNDNRTFENIELRYSIEPMGLSVSVPQTISQEDIGLPFSSIALIAAFAALGTMFTLLSVKKMHSRR